MKEIRRAIEFYRKRVRASMIAAPLFILLCVVIAIKFFTTLQQLWWFGLMFLVLAIGVLVWLIFFVKSVKRRLKTMEEELRKAEKLNQQLQAE